MTPFFLGQGTFSFLALGMRLLLSTGLSCLRLKEAKLDREKRKIAISASIALRKRSCLICHRKINRRKVFWRSSGSIIYGEKNYAKFKKNHVVLRVILCVW